jgi:aminopeptidase N
MKSTDARSALPCFDEPAMKAKFKLTVIHNKDLKAFSNMPGNSTEL